MDALSSFAYYVFPLIVLIGGTFGNILGIVVLSRKPMNKIGPRQMYIFSFISDILILILVIVNYLQAGYDYDLTIISKATCKIYWYLNFSIASISPMLLVYISFEKAVSIHKPSKRYFFRKQKTQFIYFLMTISYNFVVYLPILFFFTIENQSDDTSNTTTTICNIKDEQSRLVAYYFDTSNRVYVPFFLMIICSFFLIKSIIKMRNRISESVRLNNHQHSKKDIQLLFSLVFVNFAYILLNFPYLVVGWFSFSGYFFIIACYVSYSVYGINFFIISVSNSLFRKEFVLLLTDSLKLFKFK